MKFKSIPEGCTQEMVDFYWQRTENHIALVKKYAELIFDFDPAKYRQLGAQVSRHDSSKFEELEYTPYIWITWRYRCKDTGDKFECPDDMEESMDEATLHHVLNNRHHPELHDDSTPQDQMINKEDRDKISTLVDARAMSDVDIAEMVSDWCAMSEERHNTPHSWADSVVNKRWKFNDEQKDLIYELMDEIWEDTNE